MSLLPRCVDIVYGRYAGYPHCKRYIPSISRVIPGRSRSVFLASDELLTSVAGCSLKERFPLQFVRTLTFTTVSSGSR